MKYIFNVQDNECYYTWALAPQVSALRDTFRYGDGVSQIVNQPLGADWKVSDIGTYETTPGLARCFFFALRNTVTKVEYVFIKPGRMTAISVETDSSSYFASEAEMFGWSTNILNYILYGNDNTGVTASTSAMGPLYIIYNPDYTIASSTGGFGFNDAVELTYTGGDFTVMATPPTSEAIFTSTWLRSHCPKMLGLHSNTIVSTTPYIRTVNFVIDDTANFMRILVATSIGSNKIYLIAILAKDLFINSDSANTNTTGVLYSNFDIGTSNNNATSNLTYFNYGSGFDATGARTLYHGISSNQFTVRNIFAADNTIHWRRLQAVKDTNYKGYFNPLYVREAGQYNSFFGDGQRFLDPDTNEVYDVLHDGLAYVGDSRVPGLNYATKNILLSSSIFIAP